MGGWLGGRTGWLSAGTMLDQLLFAVPELRAFANLKLDIPFNLDSSRIGPAEWVKLARLMHHNRDDYDAFLIVHGTDTMAYTAAALSFMLAGLRKPVVLTGPSEHCDAPAHALVTCIMTWQSLLSAAPWTKQWQPVCSGLVTAGTRSCHCVAGLACVTPARGTAWVPLVARVATCRRPCCAHADATT